MPTKKKSKTVAVSGGFDPLHIGHVRMFKNAKKLGNKLIIILNNDNWLKTKKGFVFMSQEERKEIIESFEIVDDVVITEHKINDNDRSVCRELEKIKPDIFANGGDRKNENDIPEAAICKKFNIEMVFNVGVGGKIQSSSWLVDGAIKNKKDVTYKPWGSYENLKTGKNWHIKIIDVLKGKRLSLQSHKLRDELWIALNGKGVALIEDLKSKKFFDYKLKEGDKVFIPKGTKHRLAAVSDLKIAEISFGKFDENDIIRYKDDFGRT